MMFEKRLVWFIGMFLCFCGTVAFRDWFFYRLQVWFVPIYKIMIDKIILFKKGTFLFRKYTV